MKIETPEICWHGRERIMSVDFYPNSDYLVTAGCDTEERSYMKLWKVSDRKLDAASVFSVANEPDRKLFSLYSIIPEYQYDLINGHLGTVNIARFSPNGQYLASGGDDNCVILWKQKYRPVEFGSTEERLIWCSCKILRGHSSDVYDLCWSSDSQYLVSGSIDNSSILWNIVKGKSIQRLEGHSHFVQGVTIDPLKKFVLTQSSDRTVRVYKNTKSKMSLQYFLGYVLKKKEVEEVEESKNELNRANSNDNIGTRPTNENKNTENINEASNAESLTYYKKYLFAEESAHPSFFRRLSFSVDGSFVLLPAGIYQDSEESNNKYTVHGLLRTNISEPAFSIPGLTRTAIATRFCPFIFEKKESNTPALIKLPYRMVFAIATIDSILIYTTDSIIPYAYVSNIHYAPLTDITWCGDNKLLVSSSDGYCSIIKFEDKELGRRLDLSEIPEDIRHIFEGYNEIDMGKISVTNGISTHKKQDDVSMNIEPVPPQEIMIKSAKNRQIVLTKVNEGEQSVINIPQKEINEEKNDEKEPMRDGDGANEKILRRIVPVLMEE